MSYNFCTPELTTYICTDTVSCDGHSVHNLISSNEVERSKGFLAGAFIKPPVYVYFDFICNINIRHIIVWPRVGGQMSIGLEVSTKSGILSLRNGCNESDAKVNKMLPTSFRPVAYALLDGEETGFVFHRNADKLAKLHECYKGFSWHSFNSIKYLHDIRSLQIKIFRTQGSTVPALLKVEIWGYPSRSVSRCIHFKVKDIWARTCEISHPVGSRQIKPLIIARSIETTNENCLDKLMDIPEEFLDPITYEIMTLPMALPSGKIADLSTLEKFNKAEGQWGRCNSDPFTGMTFTDDRKPVIASALKMRIDKFLLEHCDKPELKLIPRTVGRNPLVKGPNQIGTTISNNEFKIKKDLKRPKYKEAESVTTKIMKTGPYKCSASSALQLDTLPESFSSVTPASFRYNTQNVVPVPLPPKLPYVVGKSRFRIIHSNNKKFNNLLGFRGLENKYVEKNALWQDSDAKLDIVLKSALSGLPSFLDSSHHHVQVKSPAIKCSICVSTSDLYHLPCTHLICRSCLVKFSNKSEHSCYQCHSVFKRSDAIRFHI